MMKMSRIAAALATLAASGAAFAHPGHATVARTVDEWLHLVLSPDHLPALAVLALVVAGLGAAAIERSLRRERRRDPR